MNDDELPSPRGHGAEGDLLARYASGTATDAERRAIEARVREDAALRAELERLELVWQRADGALRLPLDAAEVDRAWARLSAALHPDAAAATALPLREPTGGRGRLAPRHGRGMHRWRRSLIAASLLVAAAVAVWTLAPHPFTEPSRIAPIAAREHVAPVGAPLSITLADGSRAVLAPGSRLTETDPAAPDGRSVTLEGRAYFDVLPDPARPFRVAAGGTVTRVLGTSFDVRAYAGTSATEVVVRSGRVAVRPASLSEDGARPLAPGDRATLGADGSVAVESGVDVDALIGWTTGALAFRGTPLRDVVPELEGWFDLQIRIADSGLGDRRITATFHGEPRDVVLGAVAELVDARVERNGRQVVFAPFRPR